MQKNPQTPENMNEPLAVHFLCSRETGEVFDMLHIRRSTAAMLNSTASFKNNKLRFQSTKPKSGKPVSKAGSTKSTTKGN